MENFTFSSSQTLQEAKDGFHELFHFLKVEFFTKTHQDKAASWSRFQISDLQQQIGALGAKNKNGILVVNSRMRVSELEQEFQEIFGFGIQVFRKSKEIWLETTQTDSWNLETQNHHGRESMESFGTMIYDPREES